MKRLYLLPDATERTPTPEERSHHGIAKTELGADWNGTAEDAYVAMWTRGWVRVVEHPDRVYAEMYLDGQPVPLANLTNAQRLWLERKMANGKAVVWNSAAFRSTREGKPPLASS